LTSDEINFLIDSVYENYEVDENPEITLEANPMICLSTNIRIIKSKINRLSIGIQSFFEDDLKMMNERIIRRKPKNV
jgi:oxygen-independent coproporphyrinogen-3 oxidase